MILNSTYYQTLLDQYKSYPTVLSDLDEQIARLSLKMILNNCRQEDPIHINFQSRSQTIMEICRHLFVELASDIYINYPDLPSDYQIGDKLKRIRDKKYYEVIGIKKKGYILKELLRRNQRNPSPSTLPNVSYESLCKGFVKISTETGVRNTTIKNYFNFFEDINKQEDEVGFLKIYFERKCVFIARKSFWDSLTVKTKIPSVYLPNPREESDHNEIRTIPALPDCIMYVTPKYEQCYQQILQQKKKIKTIVFIDTEEDKIQQVLQDKNRFGFNIIILSNSTIPIKHNSIPCWNWFNEEIEIVNAL